MKKLSVLIVAIVVLAWAGATWYTGERIERDVEAHAAQWVTPMAESAPELVSYERGFLHSTAEWRLAPAVPGGEPLTARSQIEHGPFPWSRLRQAEFVPVLAWVNVEPFDAGGWQPWFRHARGLPWQLHAAVHYRGAVDFVTTFAAVDAADPEVTLRTSPGRVAGHVGANAEVVRVSAEWQSLQVQTSAAATMPGEPTALAFENLQWRSEHHVGEAGWYPGETVVSAAAVQIDTIDDDGRPLPVRLRDVEVAARLQESAGERLDAGFDYRIGEAAAAGQPLGELEARLRVERLHGPTLRDGVLAWQELQVASGGMPVRGDVDAVVNATLEALLTYEPRLAIDPLRWTLPQGHSWLEASATLQPPEASEDPMSLLQALDARLVVSRPMAVEVMARLAQLPGGSGMSLDAARAAASINVAFMERLALASGYVVASDDHLMIHVERRNQQWWLNGSVWADGDNVLPALPLP